MGDPHYNTWGGKNNSWGNKNRKGKSSGGSQRDDEKWSRGAKIAVVGVVLLVLANTGFGPIIETAQNVVDVFDFGKDVKKQVTSNNNATQSKGSNKVKSGEENYKSVKYDIDLDASDVKDILDFFNTQFEASGVDTNKMKVYIII